MMSMILASVFFMPLNSMSALAAENAREAAAETAVPKEAARIDSEEEEPAEEQALAGSVATSGEQSEAEEVCDPKGIEETQAADAVEGTESEDPLEQGPEDIIEEDASEEAAQRDASEERSTEPSDSGESANAEASAAVAASENPLPASAKVTVTNVASGLKVRWEPVPDAREYVVYRGSTRIKRTSKTEITDTDVKYNNGKKYTYKVAAVSRSGKISTKTRSSTYYRLLPVGITSVKQTGEGRMTVTYDKNAKGTGYVVRFDTDKEMRYAKVIAVKDPGKTSKVFSGLSEEMTYYVQVRSYKLEDGKRYYSGYCTTKSVKIAVVQKSLNMLEQNHEYTSLDITGDGKKDRFKILVSGWDGKSRPGYKNVAISVNGKTAYRFNCTEGMDDIFLLQPTLIRLENGRVFLSLTNNDGEDGFYSPLNVLLQYKNGEFATVFDFDKIFKPHCRSCTCGPIAVSGNNVSFGVHMFTWPDYSDKGYFKGNIRMQFIYRDGTLRENSTATCVSEDSSTICICKNISAYSDPDQKNFAFSLNKGEEVTADKCSITPSKMLLRVKKGSKYGWILLGKGVIDLENMPW